MWLWEEWADRRNICLKWKQVPLLILYYIDKNWYPFYQRISRLIFKICFSKSCFLPSGVIKWTCFGNFTHPQIQFGHPKPSSEYQVMSLFSIIFIRAFSIVITGIVWGISLFMSWLIWPTLILFHSFSWALICCWSINFLLLLQGIFGTLVPTIGTSSSSSWDFPTWFFIAGLFLTLFLLFTSLFHIFFFNSLFIN